MGTKKENKTTATSSFLWRQELVSRGGAQLAAGTGHHPSSKPARWQCQVSAVTVPAKGQALGMETGPQGLFHPLQPLESRASSREVTPTSAALRRGPRAGKHCPGTFLRESSPGEVKRSLAALRFQRGHLPLSKPLCLMAYLLPW